MEKTGKFEWVPMTQQRPKEPTRKVVGETSSKYTSVSQEKQDVSQFSKCLECRGGVSTKLMSREGAWIELTWGAG